jgi:hypothetical protein
MRDLRRSIKREKREAFFCADLITGGGLGFGGQLEEDLEHGVDDSGRLSRQLLRLVALQNVEQRRHGTTANAWGANLGNGSDLSLILEGGDLFVCNSQIQFETTVPSHPWTSNCCRKLFDVTLKLNIAILGSAD